MDYLEKAKQWWEKLNNGKGEKIECVIVIEKE